MRMHKLDPSNPTHIIFAGASASRWGKSQEAKSLYRNPNRFLLNLLGALLFGISANLAVWGNEPGDQKIWSVKEGSLPAGWYDTLEDAGHGLRIIEFVGTENPDEYFRIKIDTRIVERHAVSGENQIFIGIQPTSDTYGYPSSTEGFDFEVDWGDGTVERLTDADRTQVEGSKQEGFLHTYEQPGIYEITMKGEIPYWSAVPDQAKWLEIRNWGTQELKAAIEILGKARHLQIIGDALKFPPVTPNVIRWYRALYWTSSDYHPAYDTRSAHLLDRMFYTADLKRAPPLDTSQCRNFHNFFRAATSLQGAIPHYDTSKGEFFYRFFRYAKLLRTEDIPPLDTSQGRVFEGMFADLPLVHRIPDGYDFSQAGQPFSDENWVPYGHVTNLQRALSLFAAAYTGELGVLQPGDESGLETIGNLEFHTPANMSMAFRKNSGITALEDLNLTMGSGPGLFQQSKLEVVRGTIARDDSLHPQGSLNHAFASCENLNSADLHLPGWAILFGLFSNTPIKHLTLDAPDYRSHFNLILTNLTALESLVLPNWSSEMDFSIRYSAMDRDAIMALVESLPKRTTPVTIFIAGAAGADQVTQEDVDAAKAKNWILSKEISDLPELTIGKISEFTALEVEDNWWVPVLGATEGVDHIYAAGSTFWMTADKGQSWNTVNLGLELERFWTFHANQNKVFLLGLIGGSNAFYVLDAENPEKRKDLSFAWNAVASDLVPSNLWVDATNPDRIAVVGFDPKDRNLPKLIVSEDGGASFVSREMPADVSPFVAHSHIHNGQLRIFEGGKVYTADSMSGEFDAGKEIISTESFLALEEHGGTLHLLGDTGTYLTSEDAGQTWKDRSFVTHLPLGRIGFNGNKILIVGSHGEGGAGNEVLFFSDDLGDSWKQNTRLDSGAGHANIYLKDNSFISLGWRAGERTVREIAFR